MSKFNGRSGFFFLEMVLALTLLLALCLSVGKSLGFHGLRLDACRNMAEFAEYRRAIVAFLRRDPDPPKVFWLHRDGDGVLQICNEDSPRLPRVELEREGDLLLRCDLFLGPQPYSFLAAPFPSPLVPTSFP